MVYKRVEATVAEAVEEQNVCAYGSPVPVFISAARESFHG